MVRMIAGMLIEETEADLGKSAADPTPTVIGCWYYNTTLGLFRYWNGTVWATGYATDPTPTAVGDMYYNTTLGLFRYWNGTVWTTLQSISKGSIFNTAIGANANFFAADLVPTSTPTLFRIYVCLSVAGVFNVQRTHGGVTVTENLNAGNALVANAAYMFDTLVDAGDTINLQTTVATTIIECSIVEKDNVE